MKHMNLVRSCRKGAALLLCLFVLFSAMIVHCLAVSCPCFLCGFFFIHIDMVGEAGYNSAIPEAKKPYLSARPR